MRRAPQGTSEEQMDNYTDASGWTRPITPGAHAVLDYAVAATFLVKGMSLMSTHRRAGGLALVNGGMVLAMSLMTAYPGGVWPQFSFKAHRTGDIGQAALAALGPMLLGFARDPEAAFFYTQAASEVGVIAATDWDGDVTRSPRGAIESNASL
jgi:hypothetical protein